MKYNKIYIWIFAATFLFAAIACEKIVPVEQEDPNAFPGSSEELMINGPEVASVMVAEGELARITGMFTHQFTGADRQYISIDQFNVTSGDFDNIWTILYVDGVKQAKLVQEYARQSNKKEYLGVAQILEAYFIGTAASLWGDVPFTQAGNGETYPNPKFDDQKDVYNGVLDLLDEGILNAGSTVVDALPYKNESGITWGQVANSLKARYALHMKDYPNAAIYAASGLSGSAPSGDWAANHGGASAEWTWTDGQMNIMSSFMDYYRIGYMSADNAYLARIMDPYSAEYISNAKSDESARFDFFYLRASDCYWCYASEYDPNFETGIFVDNAPYAIFTVAENELIIAESAYHGGNYGEAVSHLNNARNYWDNRIGGDSFQDLLELDFEVNGIMNNDSVFSGTKEEALYHEILLEKYKATYGHIEAFNDMRRTNNALNIPIKNGTAYPERFLYPQEEISSNTSTPTGLGLFVKTKVNQ